MTLIGNREMREKVDFVPLHCGVQKALAVGLSISKYHGQLNQTA